MNEQITHEQVPGAVLTDDDLGQAVGAGDGPTTAGENNG